MNPYSKLTDYMRTQSKAVAGYDMARAVVTRVNPIAVQIGEVEIGEVEIGDNIYCNPALTLGLSPAAISTEETELKACLNSFYSAFKLSVGDTVLVQQVRDAGQGDSFFIVCKAVEV